eukprot:GHVH01016316.1.p1 GENE.GHVH01016316.1~~GHVH01016316.1.p1  ORF type:complete len:307 (+),score=48.11 GHVH01016316.1:25-921(+)
MSHCDGNHLASSAPCSAARFPSDAVVSSEVYDFMLRFIDDENESKKRREEDIVKWYKMKDWLDKSKCDDYQGNDGASSGTVRDYDYFQKLENDIGHDQEKEAELRKLTLKIADLGSYARELYPGVRACSGDHQAERMIYEMPEKDKVDAIVKFKELGNDAYKKNDLDSSACYYQRGLIYCDYTFPNTPELTNQFEQLEEALHLNMAIVLLKLEDYRTVLTHTYQVLWRNPKNIKGHLRKGDAHVGLLEYTEAQKAYESGLQLDPTNAALINAMRNLENRVKVYNDSLRTKAQAMVNQN